MKVFVSYRRDDTGGRAGRLFDVFAAKYGAGRVFQDVTSSSPGVDFTQRIESTIAQSDVVLVVIGPTWLSSATPEGERRIDQPDDFVRREVGAALTAETRVVPVLVDNAQLPSRDELPDELAALVHRQAVSVHDASWHQDVDALIRQLEGQRLPLVGRRRTTALVIGAVVALVVIGVVVALIANDDEDSADSDGGLPKCPATNAPWTPVEPANEPAAQYDTDESHVVSAQVVGGWTRSDGSGTGVLVDLDVTNITEPIDGTFEDDVYLGLGPIQGVLVDGIDQGDAYCISVKGDPELQPGQRAIATIGWDTNLDPTGAAITLQAFEGQRLAVSAG